METVRHSPPGLYARTLGDSWSSLAESVRRLHAPGETVRAVGVFRVSHGSSGPARLLARLAGLPRLGEAVDVRLVVTPRADGEEWRRSFAGRSLVSRQYAGPDGLLAERMGLAELRFRLEVTDGALAYRSVNAALCLGPWRVSLSRRLCPVVSARETPAGQGDQVHVNIEVSLPLLGRLIAYEGTLTFGVEPP
jgi:hypothetical protein